MVDNNVQKTSTAPAQSYDAQQAQILQNAAAAHQAELRANEAAIAATKRAAVAKNSVFGNASGPKVLRGAGPTAGKKGR